MRSPLVQPPERFRKESLLRAESARGTEGGQFFITPERVVIGRPADFRRALRARVGRSAVGLSQMIRAAPPIGLCRGLTASDASDERATSGPSAGFGVAAGSAAAFAEGSGARFCLNDGRDVPPQSARQQARWRDEPSSQGASSAPPACRPHSPARFCSPLS